MKNKYDIRGETTAIIIQRRNGDLYETLIDTCDLPKMDEYSGTWSLKMRTSDKRVAYAAGNVRENGVSKRIFMHRWLLNPPNDMEIDHINHNTLDNRRGNLKIVNHSENMKNLKPRNSESRRKYYQRKTQEYRYYFKDHGKYRAVKRVDGKLQCFGTYDTPQEARGVVMAYIENQKQKKGDESA